MKGIKNLILEHKVGIGACLVMGIFCIVWWILANPATTSIGEDITVGNNLTVNGKTTFNGDVAWSGDHSDSGYVRIGDLQIAWGSLTITVESLYSNDAVSFPVAFLEAPKIQVTAQISSTNCYSSFYSPSTTGFTARTFYHSATVGGTNDIHWIAIGRWQ